MDLIESFRDPGLARTLCQRIEDLYRKVSRPVRIMEVCGTHTHAIGRFGIRQVLPAGINLISGPGCPVCVTDGGYVDCAIGLAAEGKIVATFGDMLRVPGARGTLAEVRARGGDVRICYSPLEAIGLARQYPERDVVFLGIGFETTCGPIAGMIDAAIGERLTNISVLAAFKLVIPALKALSVAEDLKLDAFLCPAHVSAIIGADAYEEIASNYHRPCVIAGFEPLDILGAVEAILRQVVRGEARVENLYSRVVKRAGNRKAWALIQKYLEPADAVWRGIGMIPGSGLALREEYVQLDAEKRFGLNLMDRQGQMPDGCSCGDVLRGLIEPARCPLFGKTCTPEHPIGPCMVSSEGSCAAWYRYCGASQEELGAN